MDALSGNPRYSFLACGTGVICAIFHYHGAFVSSKRFGGLQRCGFFVMVFGDSGVFIGGDMCIIGGRRIGGQVWRREDGEVCLIAIDMRGNVAAYDGQRDTAFCLLCAGGRERGDGNADIKRLMGGSLWHKASRRGAGIDTSINGIFQRRRTGNIRIDAGHRIRLAHHSPGKRLLHDRRHNPIRQNPNATPPPAKITQHDINGGNDNHKISRHKKFCIILCQKCAECVYNAMRWWFTNGGLT